MTKVTVGARVEAEVLAQLDNITAALSEQAARIAFDRGIGIFARALGLPETKGGKSARKPK